MANDDKKKGTTSGNDSTIASPYTLRPSDNQGMIISPVQLRGGNCDEWARSMRNAFRAKKKFGFIDGIVGCKCNITAELMKKQENGRIYQFLIGLDDAVFGTVRSNILSMEHIPSLMRVYSMIVQEERPIVLHEPKMNEEMQ
ncbi:hypothetical protein Salat_2145300 [Sesamum alatum]|uniref:Retrotransposon Copia-like N-terminal domain-containing protein n=1 Tax=Sesamum alatum TaxID=300844 RepID=A0AAE1Y1A3_9LAMI|nr:hypothetical protein Salat_2145300 [Sesamum alatum]